MMSSDRANRPLERSRIEALLREPAAQVTLVVLRVPVAGFLGSAQLAQEIRRHLCGRWCGAQRRQVERGGRAGVPGRREVVRFADQRKDVAWIGCKQAIDGVDARVVGAGCHCAARIVA